jgi:hypothetical protein
MRVLGKKLHRHVTRFYCFIGDMSPNSLLTDIWSTIGELQAMRANNDDWEHVQPESDTEDVIFETDDSSEGSELQEWLV